MAICCIIMGESGSGKSTSLRTFPEGSVGVINCLNKPLPFKNKLQTINNASYEDIAKALANPAKKAYVIDDAGMLMVNSQFNKINEVGYNKFVTIAQEWMNLCSFIINEMPQDVIVYLLMHVDKEDGITKVKSIGKMLTSNLGNIESLVTICLHAVKEEDGYHFITNNEINATTKSPIDMLPEKMDNSLYDVDLAIRDFYNMPPLVTSTPTPKSKKA